MCALMCSLLNPLQSTLLLPTSVTVTTWLQWQLKTLSIDISIFKIPFFQWWSFSSFIVQKMSSSAGKSVFMVAYVSFVDMCVMWGYWTSLLIWGDREAWKNLVMTLLHDIGCWHSFNGSACMLNSIYCPNRLSFFEQDQNELPLVALSGALWATKMHDTKNDF